MTEIEYQQNNQDLTIEELLSEANELMQSMIQAAERILITLSLIKKRQPFFKLMEIRSNFFLAIWYLRYRFTFLCNSATYPVGHKNKRSNQ